MLVEKTLFGIQDKVKYAIKQIQLHEPNEGYYVAFSGGKDSCVVLDLVKKSGVKYDAHHNITNVEPPELIYFIRDNFPEVKEEIPKVTMWDLIIKNRMPPTRIARYCCKELKERGGSGRVRITGIRHAESVKRSKRKMIEPCYNSKTGLFVNPIIDWSDLEVWQYIREYSLSYCCLYDQGWSRIGCIMCPMAGRKKMIADGNKYPKIKQQFIRTFDKMLNKRKLDGLPKDNWDTGQDVFDWWTTENDKQEYGQETLNFT